jgi:hypothetical protein
MKKSKKNRNSFAILANGRRSGVHKNKKNKRKNGKNKQEEYLNEEY